ncbi:MAG: acetoin utilization AcuB family protein [Ectobacillus sp.]
MIVEEIMNANAIALSPADTIETALRTLAAKSIRHIPIVNEENEIVGIISDRDIRDACPSILDTNVSTDTLKQPIERIMTKNVITCHPLDFVEEVATVFYDNKIGCLPVTKEGKLVGIITEKNLLHTLIELTGVHQPGSQIEVKVTNEPGILSKVVAVFAKMNTNIVSVLVYPDKDENHKVLVFRIQTMNPLKIIEALRKEGYQVLWPNLTGIS